MHATFFFLNSLPPQELVHLISCRVWLNETILRKNMVNFTIQIFKNNEPMILRGCISRRAHIGSNNTNHTLSIKNKTWVTRSITVPVWCEKTASYEQEAACSVFSLEEICVCLSSSCPGWVLHYKVLSPNCQNQLTWIMNAYWRCWSWVLILFQLTLFLRIQSGWILHQVQGANSFTDKR